MFLSVMLEIAFESLEANLKTYFSRVCLANWISIIFFIFISSFPYIYYFLISYNLFRFGNCLYPFLLICNRICSFLLACYSFLLLSTALLFIIRFYSFTSCFYSSLLIYQSFVLIYQLFRILVLAQHKNHKRILTKKLVMEKFQSSLKILKP